MKPLLFSLFIALALAGRTFSTTLEDPTIGVSLTVPDTWTIEHFADRETKFTLVPPNAQQRNNLRRQIHLAVLTSQAASLEQAHQEEMDRITQRYPQGSGNDRAHFLGLTPVVTRSGLKGIRADFANRYPPKASGAASADDYPSGTIYTINKYFFRNRDGRIFKVCAHLYGDKAVAEEIDKAILDGLKYLPSK